MEETRIGDTGESYIVAYRHIIVHRERGSISLWSGHKRIGPATAS